MRHLRFCGAPDALLLVIIALLIGATDPKLPAHPLMLVVGLALVAAGLVMVAIAVRRRRAFERGFYLWS